MGRMKSAYTNFGATVRVAAIRLGRAPKRKERDEPDSSQFKTLLPILMSIGRLLPCLEISLRGFEESIIPAGRVRQVENHGSEYSYDTKRR